MTLKLQQCDWIRSTVKFEPQNACHKSLGYQTQLCNLTLETDDVTSASG